MRFGSNWTGIIYFSFLFFSLRWCTMWKTIFWPEISFLCFCHIKLFSSLSSYDSFFYILISGVCIFMYAEWLLAAGFCWQLYELSPGRSSIKCSKWKTTGGVDVLQRRGRFKFSVLPNMPDSELASRVMFNTTSHLLLLDFLIQFPSTRKK